MIKSLAAVIGTNFKNASRTLSMAVLELKKMYSNSALGVLWAMIKPTLFVLVYWFGIQFGIRGGKQTDGEPFLLWLIAGILPWFFISEALVQCGTSIRKQRHLVTKSVFPIATIPTITEIALFTVHLMLVAVALVIFVASGYASLYLVQIVYGLVCSFMLMWVISMFFSALVVVSRDFEYLLKSATQVLFWISPILWDIERVKDIPLVYWIVRVNPISYVVDVYRDAFFGRLCFADVKGLALFWIEMAVGALIACFVFKRLEPEFADIL